MLRHVAPAAAAAILLVSGYAEATGASVAGGARWKSDRIAISVDPSLDEIGSEAFSSALSAARTWHDVGAGSPELLLERRKATPVGYFPGKKNQNSVRLSVHGEPLAHGAVAITVATYEASSGTLLDADVVLNGFYRFSDGSENGKKGKKKRYDLQAVLTHELGHLHGLADDHERDHVVMYVKTLPEDDHKRTLAPEDEQALLSLYGFAGGGAESEAGSASCASAARSPASAAWASAGMLVALGLAARRRRQLGRALLLSAGLGLAATPATAEAPAGVLSGPAGTLFATVDGVSARWDGGLIVSELALSDVSCTGDCGSTSERVRVPGGRLVNILQVVSHVEVPQPGARVEIQVTRRGGLGRHRVVPHGKHTARSR